MLGSSILVSLASLLVSLIGFANQIVLARLFGASVSMDAYLIAISIPMFVSGVVSVGLGYSLVPALMVHKSDQNSYRRFSGLLLIIVIGVAVAIVTVGLLLTPLQIGTLGRTLSFEAQQDALIIARVSWLTAGVMVVVAYLRGLHNAKNRFLLATFASMVPFICMIVAGLTLAPVYGPSTVAWSMLVGFLLIIPLMLIRTTSDLDLSPKCIQLWQSVVEYLFRAPIVIVGMLCFTVFQAIDAFWAPQIGTGNLAYLGYSQRLLVTLGNLVVAGPIAVILPRFAAAFAEGRISDLLDDTLRAVRMVMAFSLPLAVTVSILATPVVSLLFERGAFDVTTTQGVADLLPLMMSGMVPMLCVAVVFRALFAKYDIYWVSILGGSTTVLYFALSGFLSKQLEAHGIALAYSLTWWVIFTASSLILWRGRLQMIANFNNILYTGKMMVLMVTVALIAEIGNISIDTLQLHSIALILHILLILIFIAITYLVVAIRILKVNEIESIYTYIAKRFTLQSATALIQFNKFKE